MSETRTANEIMQAPGAEGALTVLDSPGGAGAAGAMLNFIAAKAARADLPAEQLKILLDMQRQVIADDARERFNSALLAAQTEMPKVSKNGVVEMGQKGKMPFAKWEDVDAICRPIMQKYGFTVSFSAESADGGRSTYSAIFKHTAGHTERISIVLPPDVGPGRNALQAIGSSSSYAKRYLVENFFNIIRKGQDDDGDKGGKHYISTEMVAEIDDLLLRSGSSIDGFLRHYGVNSVEELETAAFVPAKNQLIGIINAREKRKQQGSNAP